VHVHHGLSPNADDWARFCRALCRRWKVPLTVRRVKVARSGSGLEDAALIDGLIAKLDTAMSLIDEASRGNGSPAEIDRNEVLQVALFRPASGFESTHYLHVDQSEAQPMGAVFAAKAAIPYAATIGLEKGLELETELFGRCFAMEEKKKAMQAFLEKRK
jgi:hypothetical protein